VKASKLSAAVVLVLVTSAFAAEVKSDYDRSFDLQKLHSFKFSNQSQRSPKDALANNDLVAKRLRMAIHNNLLAMGMESQETEADFEIAYYATARNQAQITTSGRPRWGAGTVWIDEHLEGTAIIEFRSAKSGEIVWRGFVTGTVDPNKSEQNINKGIKKLIERFAKDREKQQRAAQVVAAPGETQCS
jgi:hypothetical protein